MTRAVNIIFQVAALIVQSANQFSELVPVEYRHYVALVLGIAQAIVALKAHSVNPDGTPASVAFKP